MLCVQENFLRKACLTGYQSLVASWSRKSQSQRESWVRKWEINSHLDVAIQEKIVRFRAVARRSRKFNQSKNGNQAMRTKTFAIETLVINCKTPNVLFSGHGLLRQKLSKEIEGSVAFCQHITLSKTCEGC